MSVLDCPHASACGACALMGMPLRKQLAEKRGILRDALHQWEELRDVEPLRTLESPLVEGYRNRAKMAWDAKQGALGYFRPRSRFVVDAEECLVLIPELLETTRRLRRLFEDDELVPRKLRFIDLRCGSDPRRQHLTFVVGAPDVRIPVGEVRRACPDVAGIGVNVNPGAGSQVIKGRVEHAGGDERVRFDLEDATLIVSPASFFQVNEGMLHRVHQRLAEFFGAAGEGETLADLYAGVGTHGIALRHSFGRVLCVEGVSAAVRDCRSSIEASRARNVSVMAAPVERSLSTVWTERPWGVVMNPSREGARRDVLVSLMRGQAERLAYLSCNAETLARDLVVLSEAFRIRSVEPLDMMPQTLQVEALALLTR